MKVLDQIIALSKRASISTQKKIKLIKQKGNILKLKNPVRWKGQEHNQILTDGIRKQSGKYCIVSREFDSPWADSLEKLVELIDWNDYESRE